MEEKKLHRGVTRELSEIIEDIEAHSGAAFHRSTPVEYAAKLGIEATNIGSAALLSTRKSNNLYFNRIVGLGLATRATIEQLSEFSIIIQSEESSDSPLNSAHWQDPMKLRVGSTNEGFTNQKVQRSYGETVHPPRT